MLLKARGEGPFSLCRAASCTKDGTCYITLYRQNRTVWLCPEHYESVREANQALWRARR